MDFPQKMKQRALFGALTEASEDKRLVVISDLGSLSGKTSPLAKFLREANKDSLNCLIVTDKYNKNIWQAGRNIPFVTICPFSQLSTYEVIKTKMIFMMEEALVSHPGGQSPIGSKKKDAIASLQHDTKAKTVKKASVKKKA